MKPKLVAHLKAAFRHPVDYAAVVLLQRRHTDLDRWSKSESLKPAWDERTQLIAALVPNGSSVIEFGAARLTLPKFLGPDCKYQPCDLVRRSNDTIVIDLNENLPAMERRYDFAVLSGVLEYVKDYYRLLKWLSTVADNVIFSYCPTDRLLDPLTRAQCGWINHLSEKEVLEALESADLTLIDTAGWKQQIIYKCKTA